MSSIRDLIRNQRVHSLQSCDTVSVAALYMTQCNIGAIPVMNGSRLIGIFSERDMMMKVIAARRNPEVTLISEVMTRYPFVAAPDDSIERCLIAMEQYGFRHLPVCDGDELVGFLSLRDLMRHDRREKEFKLKMIHTYPKAS